MSLSLSLSPEVSTGVIGAMKRLKQSYPMLNTDDLFHRASGLMGEHMLQGREAPAVIDDLEALFKASYDKYFADCQRTAIMEE